MSEQKSFQEKKKAIVLKILQVLVEENLTIAEAELVLHETRHKTKQTKLLFLGS